MAVTIKELAAEAGVSRGTVDRVLHNRGKVKPDVEAHVREVADRLGYFPNRAGKALALSKKAIKIGCLLPSIGNPFFDDVKQGFYKAEKELSDYAITISISEVHGFKAKTHIDAIKALLAEDCDALCVSTIDTPAIRNYLNGVIEQGVPVVAVNTDLSQTNRLCYVGCDYIECGRTAGGLISLCTCCKPNILIATGSYKMKGHNERISGFKQALDERNIEYEITKVIETQDDDSIAYKRVKTALLNNPAINCIYVAAAGVVGVGEAAIEAGFKERNKDAIIVCFDDIPGTKKLVEDKVIDYTITQEPKQQGYRAVIKLFDYFIMKSPQKDYYTNLIVKIKENIGT